jgi:superoxide reductase
MANIGEYYKTADWKTEKHVPAIDCPAQATAGETVTATVTVGKEIAHPNTTAHHIRWISVYFKPEQGNVYQVAHVEFNAHGESAEGADTGPVYTNPDVTVAFKLSQPGTLIATSLCNIHGLWESSQAIKVS